MYANTCTSYALGMDMTATDTSLQDSESRQWRMLTQDEWDAANAMAQERQSRARNLVLEHRNEYEVQLPMPEPLSASGKPLATDANFAGPAEILKRAQHDGELKRHLSLVPTSTESWDTPVDWSECVATPLERDSDLDNSAVDVDLGDDTIDLRDGSIGADRAPRPAAMARVKKKIATALHR